MEPPSLMNQKDIRNDDWKGNLYEHSPVSVAVFDNHIIFSLIASYLNTPDLKILRQTCKFLLNQVNANSKLVNNLQLTVCGESMRESVISRTTFRWKNARIIVCELSRGGIPSIIASLSDVDELRLEKKGCAYCAAPAPGTPTMNELVPHFQNLNSLCVSIDCLQDGWPIDGLCQTLLSLQHFRISGEHFHIQQNLRCRFASNMARIGSLPCKLKSFQIDSVIGVLVPKPKFEKLLESSSDVLETLKSDCGLSLFGNIHEIIFPALKNIKFRIHGKESFEFADFLKIQPGFEIIDLEVVRQKPVGILDAIRMNSSQLRILHLKGEALWDSFPESNDWAWLQNLKYLEEFEFNADPRIPLGTNENRMECHLQNAKKTPSIFSNLPSSLIKKIYLLGLEFPRRDWEIETITALSGLTHLTDLRLLRCRNVLNDEILQFICGNLTCLRVFHFGWSNEITDFGITGERDGYTSGTSLANLKGLRDLGIFLCNNVTTGGLIQAIRFHELISLDLGILKQNISDEDVLQLARNNPSLEYLGRRCHNFRPSEFFLTIRDVNQRLVKSNSKYSPHVGGIMPSSWKPSYGVLSSRPLRESQQPKIKVFQDINSSSYSYCLR